MLVHSRKGKWATWVLFFALFLPLFALPLLVVVAASFATSWSSALPTGFTGGHYRAATSGASSRRSPPAWSPPSAPASSPS